MEELDSRKLLPGVGLHCVVSPRFKTNVLSISFAQPLARGAAGLGAVLPFVLRRGTVRHPDMKSLTAALEDAYGARLEPFCRKKGEIQCAGLMATFNEDAFLPSGVDVCADVVRLTCETLLMPAGDGTGFVPDAFLGEKNQWLDRLRALKNDKGTYARKRLIELMCDAESYGVDALGEETDDVTPESLWRAYRTLLSEGRLEILYVGSKSADTLAELLADALEPLKSRRAAPGFQTEVVTGAGALRRFEETMDVAQGKLVMGMRTGVSVSDAAFPAALLLTALYGGGTTSKLFLHVRERLSLAYTVMAWMESLKGLMLVSAGIDPARRSDAEREIFAQWERVKQGEFSNGELDAARLSLCNMLRIMGDSPHRLEEHYLGQILAGLTESPGALADRVASTSREDVVDVAAGMRWDSIFFLSGEGLVHE